ncbi:hypothetical protein GGI25_001957 [Coemansia spiralis]|uniref:Uncharacterized protein n=2 Tax=Coemansia TaxID=4863 RepID=A0A9W8KZL5_9FUNG|nr:hypothetical protein EDC05_002253 [Coemansia umbellata]KAJ2623462.1 hypothetical protein GGI26_002301 [Coemansia sp. RSA 1358]KAJ2678968.1 hypothetical protein GGI25_001957 [Coemansia spiralis]
MPMQKQVRFSSHVDIIQPIQEEPLDDTAKNMAMLIHNYHHRSKVRASKDHRAHTPRPKITKESIMSDLSRYTQEAYICPFCGSNSQTYADQLVHLEVIHPWYSLDIHKEMH